MKLLLFTLSLIAFSSQSSVAQILSTEQTEYISTHFEDLKADERYQNANWEPVLNAVKGKRMVLLGEFNHGSKEVFIARNELIQQLHEKLGFDLILFESGLGELEVINMDKQELKVFELTQGFFGPWRTKEFEGLMKYIQLNEIEISGFDVQRTGSTFTDYLSEKMDNDRFKKAEEEFVALKSQLSNYNTVYDSINTPTSALIRVYEDIRDNLSIDEEFSKKAIDNRIHFLTYMMDFIKFKDWNKRWEARDRAMADNMKWILSRQEPYKKIIVIAHNFHVSKFNEKENVMGEFLSEDYADEMYVIGAFAGEGAYANNSGKPEQLSPPSEKGLDIKHIIAANQGRLAFLNITKNRQGLANWVQEPIVVNDTFVDLSNSNELILSKCFDGILLFETITPAEKQSK